MVERDGRREQKGLIVRSHVPCVRPLLNSSTRDLISGLSIIHARNNENKMGAMQNAHWAGAITIGLVVLLYPALYNGFPLVFYDTGGYIGAAFEAELIPGRSSTYGYFLRFFELVLAYWPALVIQAGMVLWLVYLIARIHGLPSRPSALTVMVSALALGTGLPWFAAQLMPDVWAPVLIMALYLLSFQAGQLTRWEYRLLGGSVIFAMASHMSHVALGIGLIVVMVGMALVCRRLSIPRSLLPRVLLPTLMVAFGIIAGPLVNSLVIGQFRFTPGSETFVFGRLIQDGIVTRFLADRCPSAEYRLCRYRNHLPTTANDWIWGIDSPFREIGGWDGGASEMARITWGSLKAYPAHHLFSALRATYRQLVTVATGDGIEPELWDVRGALEKHRPHLLQGFDGARQQRAGFSFQALNQVHVPILLGTLAGSLALLIWCVRVRNIEVTLLLGFVLLALVENAIICGALSNPHDRYQSRVGWLAMLCLMVSVFQWAKSTRRFVPNPRKAVT
jgi:hypothetical protein